MKLYPVTHHNFCIFLISREAVEHFLTALNMQRKSHGLKDPQLLMSKNIWGTLRMAVSLMGRPDLYEVCDRNDLDSLNKEFNMESWYQVKPMDNVIITTQEIDIDDLPGVLNLIFK